MVGGGMEKETGGEFPWVLGPGSPWQSESKVVRHLKIVRVSVMRQGIRQADEERRREKTRFGGKLFLEWTNDRVSQ